MKLQGQEILKRLIDAGHEAYYVGGCVRDSYLGILPKDFDIATSALPEETEALFEKTLAVGKAYGTILVITEEGHFEVTTYRLEADYDGRRPQTVSFSKSLLTDLSRRDFRMNAMALGLDGELIDPFNGRQDLDRGQLNFVGDPDQRIEEDRLRILRYIRFLCQYDLTPGDPGIGLSKPISLENLSAERIREEFNKLLTGPSPARGLRLLVEMGLLMQFFPELAACRGFLQHHPAHSEDVFDHTLSVVSNCRDDLTLRLAALCHDLGKPLTFSRDENGIGHFYGHQKISEELSQAMMKRLKYPAAMTERVMKLIRHHMRTYEQVTSAGARRLINQVGLEDLELFFELQMADTLACSGDRTVNAGQIQEMRALCIKLIEAEEAFSLKDLKIDGNDLLALGFTGRAIGEALNSLLEAVLNESCTNDKNILTEKAKDLFYERQNLPK